VNEPPRTPVVSGAGTVLMQARGRGDRVLTVWVLDTNQQGRRFHERCGLAWDDATKDVQRPECTMLQYRIEL
jgi:hypothetical protein